MAELARIPRSIAAQNEEADRIVEEIRARHAESQDSPAPEPAPAPVAAAVPEPNPPAIPGADAPVVTPQPNVAPAAFDAASADVEALRRELARLQQAHSSLQGKYRAEVPRYAAEVRELKQNLASRDEEVARLKAQLESAPRSSVSQPQGTEDPRLDALMRRPEFRELAEELGESAARAQARLSLAASGAPVTQQPVQSTASPSETASPPQPGPLDPAAKGRRIAEVASFVNAVLGDGAFQQIDGNDAFHQWLNGYDVREGMSRRDAMLRRFDAGDIHGCASFWTDWDEIQGAAARHRDPREALIDTASPNSSSPPAPAQPQLVRASEMDAFYADVTRGKYRGREAEAQQREQEFMAAVREGRVIQDRR